VAFFTSRGALVHMHFSGLPIDFWIIVLEPDVAEDHALLPEVKDGKKHPFRVGLIIEDYIYHFGDLSCFVRRAVCKGIPNPRLQSPFQSSGAIL